MATTTPPSTTAPVDPHRPLLVRMTQKLEAMAWIDTVSHLEHTVAQKTLTASPRVLSVLRGRQVGHAVHPPMTDVPIGAWLSASALDVVGGRASRPAARLLLALGCVTALPTMVTGTAEWIGTHGGDRRVGWVHAVANGTSLGIYGVSWWVRRDPERHGLGVALALAGGAVAGIGGYLGGHLSVARDIGTRDPAYSEVPGAQELGSPHRD